MQPPRVFQDISAEDHNDFPIEMLTYCHVCCAFESARALPTGVIRGCDTISINRLKFFSFLPIAIAGLTPLLSGR